MPAGYRMYAGSAADFLGEGQAGGPLTIGSGSLTVWDTIVPATGTQVTDLLDASEDPVTVVTADSFGNFRFFAPETSGSLFVDNGTERYAVHPIDLGGRVLAVETGVTDATADAANALTKAQDVSDALAAKGDIPKVTFGVGPIPETAVYPHIHFQLAGGGSTGGGGGGGATITDPFDGTFSDLGANWTETTAPGFARVSGQAAPETGSGTGMARHVTLPPSGNYYAELVYAATPTGVSVFCGPAIEVPPLGTLLTNTGSCYILVVSGTTTSSVSIRRKDMNSSVLTTLTPLITQQVTMGDVLRLAKVGNDLVGYLNGTEIIRRDSSTFPLQETGVARGVGFYSTGNTSIRFDNFAAGSV